MNEKSLEVSFGSDGAAVMTKRLSGVAVQLSCHNPRVIFVHCVNHTLALAAAYISNSMPYLKQFTANTVLFLSEQCCSHGYCACNSKNSK